MSQKGFSEEVWVATGAEAAHDWAMIVHMFLIGKSCFNLLHPNSKMPSEICTSGR